MSAQSKVNNYATAGYQRVRVCFSKYLAGCLFCDVYSQQIAHHISLQRLQSILIVKTILEKQTLK